MLLYAVSRTLYTVRSKFESSFVRVNIPTRIQYKTETVYSAHFCYCKHQAKYVAFHVKENVVLFTPSCDAVASEYFCTVTLEILRSKF